MPEAARQRPEGQCWRQKTRLKTWPQRYARIEGESCLPLANALAEMSSLVPLLPPAARANASALSCILCPGSSLRFYKQKTVEGELYRRNEPGASAAKPACAQARALTRAPAPSVPFGNTPRLLPRAARERSPARPRPPFVVR